MNDDTVSMLVLTVIALQFSLTGLLAWTFNHVVSVRESGVKPQHSKSGVSGELITLVPSVLFFRPKNLCYDQYYV